MKTKFLMIAISLASFSLFAQKKEIRNAGKAVEDGQYSQAIDFLKQAKPLISAEKESVKADFYFTKGQAYLGAEDGKNTSFENLMIAAEAFQKAKDFGNEDAKSGILAIRNALVNSAIIDQKAEKYDAAATKLYKSYELGGKKDTLYLYYAASDKVASKDYETALTYYKELAEIGYDGSETLYSAVEKKTGEKKNFSSKKERDIYMKSGNYIKPSQEVTPSKSGEIAKKIALIYVQLEKPDLAIQAIKKAQELNPDDLGLQKEEANIYYQMGKIDMYNKLMKEIVKKDPENPIMYYNLAVSSSEMGDQEGAIAYYKRAIEFDPQMENAYINLVATLLKKENGMVDAMNKALEKGNNDEYDRISNERKALYTEALPYLEKAFEINPQNIEVIRTLMNIYYVLGNPKADEMQAKLNELSK